MDLDGASSIFLLSFSVFMYNLLQDHKEPLLRCLMEKIIRSLSTLKIFSAEVIGLLPAPVHQGYNDSTVIEMGVPGSESFIMITVELQYVSNTNS
jgi:hypothetical protein